MKFTKNQSGSALIVVLGMLSVLMIMAISFSTFMRTERAGMTNLKHSLTARQTAHTTIARVMEAIDESFGDPKNNYPIPDWDVPFIASKSTSKKSDPKWQSVDMGSNTSGRTSNAHVITREMSKFLTPSQLAMARNARVEWVSVPGGVGSDESSSGLDGAPENDRIVARYAFLAFNTTGLLDMNTTVTDVLGLETLALDDTSIFRYLDINNYLDGVGGFTSFADFWNKCARTNYKNYTKYYDSAGDDILPSELFNTFTMSLDEVTPDGEMKLSIPTDTTESNFGDTQKKAFAQNAYRRFEKVFEEAEEDEIKLDGITDLTRAQLATQSLLDYIDEDDIPSGGMWDENWKEGDHLNYPCTEAVPMVTQVAAQFLRGEPVTVAPLGTEPEKWYREWEVRLAFQIDAHDFSEDPDVDGIEFLANYEMSEEKWVEFCEAAGWRLHSGANENDPSKNPWIVYINNSDFSGTVTGSPRKDWSLSAVTGSADGDIGKKFFKVRAYADSWSTDLDGKPVPETAKYFYSQLDKDNSKAPFYVTFDVSAEITKDGKSIQKVPAPKLADKPIVIMPGLYPLKDGSSEGFEIGWAYCWEPHFAYNTASMHDYPPNKGIVAWISNEMCSKNDATQEAGDIYNTDGEPYDMMHAVADRLRAQEKAADNITDLIDSRLGNPLIYKHTDGFLNAFGFSHNAGLELGVLMGAFTGGKQIVPDLYQRIEDGGEMFIHQTGENLTEIEHFRVVANKPMESVGEFGNLLVGPWETLSTFATYGFMNKINHHRAVDYFSMSEARWPTMEDIAKNTYSSKWDDNGEDNDGKGEESKQAYFPAVHHGKLNLNYNNDVMFNSADYSGSPDMNSRNAEPLATLIYGTLLKDDGKPLLDSWDDAKSAAIDFYDFVEPREDDKIPNYMYSAISDIGGEGEDNRPNPLYYILQDRGKLPDTPEKRDEVLGKLFDQITTRGQTYLAIIRADSYSPKYGSLTGTDGTTLATEYAIVELWRDSEPNRTPDGRYFPVGTDKPVHSWVIKSCRFFSP